MKVEIDGMNQIILTPENKQEERTLYCLYNHRTLYSRIDMVKPIRIGDKIQVLIA